MDEKELCEFLKRTFNALAGVVQDKTSKLEGRDFLINHFNWDNNLFCQFLGFSRVEAKTTTIPKSVLAEMFLETASAGLSIGWHTGFEDAKRCYK